MFAKFSLLISLLLFSIVACQTNKKISTQQSQEDLERAVYLKYQIFPEEVNKEISKTKRTPLYLAIESNDIEAVEIFLKNPKINIYSRPLPLLKAAYDGNLAAVNLLIDRGVRINDQNDKGYSALQLAARMGKKDVVNRLIEVGANPNLQDKNGRTALMEASARGHSEIAETLVFNKADANLVDKSNRTALIYATALNHKTIANLLIQQSVKMEQADNKGRNALIFAAQSGNIDLVRQLIQAGARVDLSGPEKMALDLAAVNGHSEVVTFLIQADKSRKQR